MVDNQYINNNFKDYLEDLAAFHKMCTIKFMAENGALSVIRDRIMDIYKEDEIDYIIIGSGIRIKVNNLIEVDGRLNGSYC